MKKIIYILMALLVISSVSFAQKQDAKSSNAAQVKTASAPADKKAAKMKKDGTPDMRMKENKNAAKQVGPMKKDGTPDKRFKANKQAKK